MKAAPFWLAGLRVASVLAVVGAIVAEFSGANAGLGYIVIVSAVRIDTPLLMTGIILSAFCGIVLYLIAIAIETLVLKRMHMEPLPE
jgi:NitT/TauT family transport system permease protein